MAIQIEKTCQECRNPFTVNRNSLAAVQKFCSRKCASAALRSDSVKSRYRTVYAPTGHPIASKWGTVLEHRLILWDKIGPGTHPCHHCGAPVTWTTQQYVTKGGLVGDHLDRDTHNNERSNLVPSCPRCNVKRRHDRVRDDEDFITYRDESRARGERRSCLHCSQSFVTFPSTDPRHPGLYCSRACVFAGKRTAATKPCANCGVEFYSPPSRTRKYCGKACYGEVQRGRPRKKRAASRAEPETSI